MYLVVIIIIILMIYWFKIVYLKVLRISFRNLYSHHSVNIGKILLLTHLLRILIIRKLSLSFKKKKHFNKVQNMIVQLRKRKKNQVNIWISQIIPLLKELNIVIRISHRKANPKIILSLLWSLRNHKKVHRCPNHPVLI